MFLLETIRGLPGHQGCETVYVTLRVNLCIGWRLQKALARLYDLTLICSLN